MKTGGAVYILMNQHHTTLYTGVTSDLLRRMYEHKTGRYKNSFSNRYNLHKLVYYEPFKNIVDAIAREKQIKAGSRKKKEILINTLNPEWKDLSCDIGFEDGSVL